MMRRQVVGGPLLGSRIDSNPQTSVNGLDCWTTFKPLVVGSHIILPQTHSLQILSAKTSKPLASFVVPPSHRITSVTLLEQTSSVWVGLENGKVCEFSLQDDEWQYDDASINNTGKSVTPRRTLTVDSNAAILHLTLVKVKEDKIFGYALLYNKSKAPTFMALVRFQVPDYDESLALGLEENHSKKLPVQVLDQLQLDKPSRIPFSLLSCSSSVSNTSTTTISSSPSGTFVLVASPASLAVYCDRPLQDNKKSKNRPENYYSVALHHPQNKNLSLTAVALTHTHNRDTVALGYWNGEIRVWNGLLSNIQDYTVKVAQYWLDMAGKDKFERKNSNKHKPEHPSSGMISQRLHWHAHPVSSLVFGGGGGDQPTSYSSNTKLYSGGEESVLVVWELERSSFKSEVLPRLSKGAIVHLDSTPDDRILAYCSDNSLQYFVAHNLSRLWVRKSLAAEPAPTTTMKNCSSPPIMINDASSSSLLMLANLPRAPGMIQWWDGNATGNNCHQVVATLEVVAFNRISRVNWDDLPLPLPRVTHARIGSNNGNSATTTLVTVDQVPTENAAIGRRSQQQQQDGVVGDDEGLVTTLRFWRIRSNSNSRSNTATSISSISSKSRFELVAAMAFPHGSEHDVSAVAVSPNGMYACTVSNSEKAWRLWTQLCDDKNNDDGNSLSWTCDYKVSMPSGHSKFDVARDGVSFSSDSTVLVMAHGPLITLWDFRNTTLINTLHHLDDDSSHVKSLELLSVQDMLLTVSATGVTLQSPYGSSGPAGWSFRLPQDGRCRTITHAECLASSKQIAIAVYDESSDTSQIYFVDLSTGKQVSEEKDLSGKIVSMASTANHPVKRRVIWEMTPQTMDLRNPNDADSPIRLFVLNSKGELLLLDSSSVTTKKEQEVQQEDLDVAVLPKISILAELDQQQQSCRKKRRLAVMDMSELGAVRDDGSANAVAALLSSSSTTATTTSSSKSASVSSLITEAPPRLGGSFVRSFVMRNLKR